MKFGNVWNSLENDEIRSFAEARPADCRRQVRAGRRATHEREQEAAAAGERAVRQLLEENITENDRRWESNMISLTAKGSERIKNNFLREN